MTPKEYMKEYNRRPEVVARDVLRQQARKTDPLYIESERLRSRQRRLDAEIPSCCVRCGSESGLTKSGRCRPCMAAYARAYRKTPAGKLAVQRSSTGPKRREARLRYEAAHPRAGSTRAESRLRKKYGIDFEDWARMYEAQNGLCPGCLEPLTFDRKTHLDHCHDTGIVRGLLCNDDNLAIGFAHNDSVRLMRLSLYLDDSRREHEAPR